MFLQNQLLTNFEGLIAKFWFSFFPVFEFLPTYNSPYACPAHAIRNFCRKATSPSPNINIASAPIVALVIIVLSAIGPHNPKANALESNKIQGDRGRMMVWAQFGKLPGHTTASQVYWPIKQMCSAVKLWKISREGISTTTIAFCLAKMFCSDQVSCAAGSPDQHHDGHLAPGGHQDPAPCLQDNKHHLLCHDACQVSHHQPLLCQQREECEG